jgi:hypothetical protein
VRHVTRLAIAAWALLALAATVAAGETLQTESFSLTFPDRWVGNFKTKPFSVKGPAGEILQLSSSSLSGLGSAEETAGVMRQVEDAAVKSMRQAESNPALVTVTPLKKTKLPSGATMHEMLSKSRDGKSLLAQFTAIGPRSVVLVTLESPAASASSVDAIRKSVAGMRWTK